MTAPVARRSDGIEHTVAGVLEMLRGGRLEEAEGACRALAQAHPRDARAHALLARALALRGHLDAACAAAESALALAPDFVPALLERAQLARRADDPERAVILLERLCALQPDNARLCYDLGDTLLRLGRDSLAQHALERARALDPLLLEASFKLALLALRRGDYEAACRDFDACVRARPDWAEAWVNLGAAELASYRPERARPAYERAVALAPGNADALMGLAQALHGTGADADAIIAASRRATEARPGSAEAWYRLAKAYRGADRHSECADALEHTLTLDPEHLSARWDRFQLPRSLVRGEVDEEQAYLARWCAGLEYFERLDTTDPKVRAALAGVRGLETNFHLHYLGQAFVELQTRFARVVERLAHAQLAPPPLPARAAGDGRLRRRRIGFVSGQFRQHSVTRLFQSLIEGVPRERFRCTLFHCDDRRDGITEALARSADEYLGGERGARDWAASIAASGMDALVYVDIGMHPIPQFLSAYRLAPLQCALWGHPVTTGSRHIDLFLSADAMEPDDGGRNYTERLVRLPRLGTCYRYPDVSPAAGLEIPARRDPGTVHYLLAQNVVKLTPAHDRLLAAIARALPSARFSLTPHPNARVRAELARRMAGEFERQGLEFARHVHLFPWLDDAGFAALAAASDVNLDSVGWSGGVTTLEITRFDVPTITLPGAVMRSRHTSAMLELMGLGELIARDERHYVELAVALGRDPALRQRLRDQTGRRKHVLYGDRAVIDAFWASIERELDGRAPGRR